MIVRGRAACLQAMRVVPQAIYKRLSRTDFRGGRFYFFLTEEIEGYRGHRGFWFLDFFHTEEKEGAEDLKIIYI